MPDIQSSELTRYRVGVAIDGRYEIRWLCGSRWLLVFGPGDPDETAAFMRFIVQELNRNW